MYPLFVSSQGLRTTNPTSSSDTNAITDVYIADVSVGNRTFNIRNDPLRPNQFCHVKVKNPTLSPGTITIVPPSGHTINGAPNLVLTTNEYATFLVKSGTNWTPFTNTLVSLSGELSKGSLIVDSDTGIQELLVGADGQALTVDMSSSLGLAWDTPPLPVVSSIPGGSTVEQIVRFDGITGHLVQGSGVYINATNDITGVVNITTFGDVATSGEFLLNGDLFMTEDASRNLVVGIGAPASVTGSDNTIMGPDVALGFTTGNRNTILGARANTTSDSLSDCIVVGADSRATSTGITLGTNTGSELTSSNQNILVGSMQTAGQTPTSQTIPSVIVGTENFIITTGAEVDGGATVYGDHIYYGIDSIVVGSFIGEPLTSYTQNIVMGVQNLRITPTLVSKSIIIGTDVAEDFEEVVDSIVITDNEGINDTPILHDAIIIGGDLNPSTGCIVMGYDSYCMDSTLSTSATREAVIIGSFANGTNLDCRQSVACGYSAYPEQFDVCIGREAVSSGSSAIVGDFNQMTGNECAVVGRGLTNFAATDRNTALGSDCDFTLADSGAIGANITAAIPGILIGEGSNIIDVYAGRDTYIPSGSLVLETVGGTATPINYYESNTQYTVYTWGGSSSASAATEITRLANVVTLKVQNVIVYGDESDVITSSDALPVRFRPPTDLHYMISISVGGVRTTGMLEVSAAGFFSVSAVSGGNLTNSSSVGFYPQNIQFTL